MPLPAAPQDADRRRCACARPLRLSRKTAAARDGGVKGETEPLLWDGGRGGGLAHRGDGAEPKVGAARDAVGGEVRDEGSGRGGGRGGCVSRLINRNTAHHCDAAL